MADRFFADEPLSLGDFSLTGPEAHHLLHVRRFTIGERITLFNGDGREYGAEILEVARKHALLRIDQINAPPRECRQPLHLGVALPKGDRADFLIEKLTELGTAEFTPLRTTRGVVQPKEQTLAKLERAVIEASKQCGRNVLMKIHPACTLREWADRIQADHRWILQPGPCEQSGQPTGSAAIAIGPEGGFTPEELADAQTAGFETMSLGPRILRVETAGIAMAAWWSIRQLGRGQ